MVARDVRVPLLSQEGPTCRLLPGATAPFPALDQELTSTAAPVAILCFVLVLIAAQGTAVLVVRPLVREGH